MLHKEDIPTSPEKGTQRLPTVIKQAGEGAICMIFRKGSGTPKSGCLGLCLQLSLYMAVWPLVSLPTLLASILLTK